MSKRGLRARESSRDSGRPADGTAVWTLDARGFTRAARSGNGTQASRAVATASEPSSVVMRRWPPVTLCDIGPMHESSSERPWTRPPIVVPRRCGVVPRETILYKQTAERGI